MVRIPGQGGHDSRINPVSIPILILSWFLDESGLLRRLPGALTGIKSAPLTILKSQLVYFPLLDSIQYTTPANNPNATTAITEPTENFPFFR